MGAARKITRLQMGVGKNRGRWVTQWGARGSHSVRRWGKEKNEGLPRDVSCVGMLLKRSK